MTAVSARSSTRSRRTPRERRNLYWGLLFTSPAIIGLLWFQAYPIVMSIYYSFTSATMVQSPSWLGLTNYQSLLNDPNFHHSLRITLQYILWSIPLGILVALVLAVLLNLKVRGQSFYRVVFYLPAIVPVVASSIVWLYFFNPQYGPVNTLLDTIGITGPGWLADPNPSLQPELIFPSWAMNAIILFTVWGAGNLMIILLAGLQDVPQELQDQAMVDGAGRLSRFRHVSLPFLSPHLLFALVTGLIAGFQFFTPVYVLSGGDGRPAASSQIVSLYLYQNAFQFFKIGYASAMAWVVFLIVAAITALVFRFVGRRVYYAGA